MKIIDDRSLPIGVIAAGKGWLAVDKPAGVTVHNAPGRDICSLAFAMIQKEPAVFDPVAMDPAFGIHPVHRLDRETSGIMLLAATPEAFRLFSKQFQSRQVQKRYIAVLHGRLDDLPGNDFWGTWRWALAKAAGGRRHPEGAGQRQTGETRFRIIDRSARYTMVEIELLTGRKHQIRRHAKLAGHPVVGDARYGSKRAANFLSRNFAFDRLGLHANSLTLLLPDATAPETIRTPAIPKQMQELFDNDRTEAVLMQIP
ncbi:MAG: RNA pseudouridine synthase [Thermodesulfobacteriota bacterium]